MMDKPVRFVHSLSFKLALATIGMLLVLWLTVGSVLVLSTAQEIIDNGPPLADSRLNLYRSDSYLQTFDPQTLDDSWVLEAQKASSGSSQFLFYDMYDAPRYLQYAFTWTEDASGTPELLPVRMFSAVLYVNPSEAEPDGLFLDLQGLSAAQLSQLSGIFTGGPDSLAFSAVGTRSGPFFYVDTLTVHGHMYSTGRTGGADTFSLNSTQEQGKPIPCRMLPNGIHTQEEWELMLGATDWVLDRAPQSSSVWQNYCSCYFSALIRIQDQSETSPGVWLGVVLASTPLKTALREQAPVLVRLLSQVPILGILFFGIIRRMVVLPLRKTQTAFQTVAALDFSEVQGDVKRRDEIGELNRSLQTMSGELQRRWDDERALERRRQEFVAAASHELKTPLALMRGYTEGLEQDIGDREQHLAGMEREIDRMNALVLDMLEETRLERIEQLQQLETVNLSCLVKDLLNEMAPLFQGLNLSTQLEENVTCPGDRSLLDRGIGNLLSNAARYCSPGRQVRITLTSGPVLTVENDADPIPEEELPRLFELFYRGDKARDRSGSGMGLAIAQRIFSLHHLSCTAENIPGGVRFRLQKEECSGTNPSKMS